jgi:hypothetical protein
LIAHKYSCRFAGGVFGDVGQPDQVRRRGGEDAFDVVVVHRRAGFAVQAAFLGVDRADPLLRTQSRNSVLACGDAQGLELVCDEPVSESRVVAVDLAGGVDQVTIRPVGSPT